MASADDLVCEPSEHGSPRASLGATSRISARSEDSDIGAMRSAAPCITARMLALRGSACREIPSICSRATGVAFRVDEYRSQQARVRSFGRVSLERPSLIRSSECNLVLAEMESAPHSAPKTSQPQLPQPHSGCPTTVVNFAAFGSSPLNADFTRAGPDPVRPCVLTPYNRSFRRIRNFPVKDTET